MTEPATTELSEVSRAAIKKAWVNRFHRWRAYALALTGSKTDAEEVVQEAITRTMNAAPQLATEQDAYHYVIAAIRSSAYRMFTRRRRRRDLSKEAAGVFNPWLDEDVAIDEAPTQIVGRGTCVPLVNEDRSSMVHLGLGARYTNAKQALAYQATPEFNQAPNFVSTGEFEAARQDLALSLLHLRQYLHL